MLEKKLGGKYACAEILGAMKGMNFADIEGRGFILLYQWEAIRDDPHDASGFWTDYPFITKKQMRRSRKKGKGRE